MRSDSPSTAENRRAANERREKLLAYLREHPETFTTKRLARITTRPAHEILKDLHVLAAKESVIGLDGGHPTMRLWRAA